MHKVNIRTFCNNLSLTTCYLWKSTGVHCGTIADSPVVLWQSLGEEEGEGSG